MFASCEEDVFFSSIGRHTGLTCDWSSDVCSSDLLLSRFVGDGKNGIAGNERLQLDEVCAASFQIVDGAAAVFWRGDCNGTRETRFGPVKHRTGSEEIGRASCRERG